MKDIPHIDKMFRSNSPPPALTGAMSVFWINHGRKTDVLDRDAAREAIFDIYQYAGYSPSKVAFEVYPSPHAAREDYLCLLKRDRPSIQQPRHLATGVLQTIFETRGKGGDRGAENLSLLLGRNLYAPVLSSMEVTHPRTLVVGRWSATRALIKMDADMRKLCVTQAYYTNLWFPYTDVVQVSEHPTQIHVDTSGRLHNEEGPALAYADGHEIYSLHGIAVPAEYVLGGVTHWHISQEQNQERKRVLIEKYGWENYIEDIKAKPIHKDSFGELYHIPIDPQRGWAIAAIAIVVNSSPEPDGTYKKYALQVDASCRRAKDAVASTFGLLDGSKYKPAIQT